jgi:hypothetical protein
LSRTAERIGQEIDTLNRSIEPALRAFPPRALPTLGNTSALVSALNPSLIDPGSL